VSRCKRRLDVPRVAALSAILEAGAGTRHVRIGYDDFVPDTLVRGAGDTEAPRRRSRQHLHQSFERALEKPETLLHAYALLNRIRLCASDAVLAQGEATLRFITEQYFSPNLSVDEMRKLVQKWTTDPLEPFGEACRLELKSMRAPV